MTNQPDRPDGDGLRERVTEALRKSSLWQSKLLTTTKWKDGIDIDEPSFAAMQFAKALVHLINERDEAQSAPPKPAPDAMREALASRIENCKGLQLYEEADTNRGYTTDTLSEEQRAEIAAALRTAAPVPPADGDKS